MKKKLNCVMLIDDDNNDNFFHEREIHKISPETVVINMNSGFEALNYLKLNENMPDLIFLDINMPEIDGWEFLSEFSRMEKSIIGGIMILMLSSSNNPTDQLRARAWGFVSGFLNKPLTKVVMEDIIKKYFVA